MSSTESVDVNGMAWLEHDVHVEQPFLTPDPLRRARTSAISGRGSLFLWRVVFLILLCGVIGFVFSAPSAGYTGYAYVLTAALAIVVLGGNIVTGFLEEINLAQGGLMAIGAYVAAFAWSHHAPFLVGVIAGTAAAAITGAALAAAVVQLTGVYAALLTFSLSYAVPDLVNYFASSTGGGNGETIPSMDLFGLSIGGSSPATVWIVTVAFLLCGLLFLVVGHGSAGRVLRASRGRAFAASTFGINPKRAKWWGWIFSSAMCGLGGSMYALVVGFLAPDQFGLTMSVYLLVGTLAGGALTAVGALIGGGLVGALPIVLSSAPGGAEPILLGALLFAIILLGASGIWTQAEIGTVSLVGMAIRRYRTVGKAPERGAAEGGEL